ncbi:MAG: oligosaccharide flippase family protein [Muribaculaceae bacterium]|nr:oligosaccharide flippase family protein [Muribaculaceae bacterium]
MMGSVKSLAKDTAIYGLSSIIGRFLNWCLVPLYTIVFPKAEYGVVTYVYAVVAVVLIILTYGMETGFFRFANHERWKDPMQVYSTALSSLAVSGTLFFALVCVFITPVSGWMKCSGHPSFVWMMALCVAVDAFTALPFSYLRYRKRPLRFAVLRLVNIGINIGLNLFFILLCPWLMKVAPGTVNWFYNPDFGIGYIFLANLIASVVTLVMLIPELRGFRWTFCAPLWKEMIVYSAPLLVLGIAGIMNQTLSTIIFPYLYVKPDTMAQLGVYGANYKIAIVMVMFIQAFRFAYEPFIFAQNKEKGVDRNRSYSDAMKFFVIMGLLIFMGVMFYLDIIKYFISPEYFSGLAVVPIVMMAEFFFGILFNLSVWYKLSDRTIWGAYISLIGLVVTVALNMLLVPQYGYMGCAWAAFFCYLTMMLVSYFVGQAKYPIPYPLGRMAGYTAVAVVLYVLGMYVLRTSVIWIDFAVRAVLIAVFVVIVARREKITVRSLVKPVMSKLGR